MKKALAVIFIGLLMVIVGILIDHAQAVSLSITGHCTGSGIMAMNYTGSMLNVTLEQNGTTWLVNATGMA
jgi:hypothetical protein